MASKEQICKENLKLEINAKYMVPKTCNCASASAFHFIRKFHPQMTCFHCENYPTAIQMTEVNVLPDIFRIQCCVCFFASYFVPFEKTKRPTKLILLLLALSLWWLVSLIKHFIKQIFECFSYFFYYWNFSTKSSNYSQIM